MEKNIRKNGKKKMVSENGLLVYLATTLLQRASSARQQLEPTYHSDLANHTSTEKHRKNAAPFSNIITLFQSGVTKASANNSVNISELKLAAHIACHSNLKTIDHLAEHVRDISCKEISLHRTKCTALLMVQVLGCFSAVF